MQSVVANLKATTAGLNALMAASTGNIGATLNHLNGISANLESGNAQIKSILNNIDTMTGKLKGVDLNKTTGGANEAIAAMRKALMTTDSALYEIKGIAAKLGTGQGTVGQLLSNDTLYTNLNTSLLNLTALTQDIRLNPKRYLNLNPFRSYKPYVLPENDPLLKLYGMRKDSLKK